MFATVRGSKSATKGKRWLLSPARLPIPPRRRLGTGAKGYEIHVQAQHRGAVECALLSASRLHGKKQSAEDSGRYSRSSIRKPRGGPRISRRIMASRKRDVDASNVVMSVLRTSALTIVGVTPASACAGALKIGGGAIGNDPS
jgi:hypothetical protein